MNSKNTTTKRTEQSPEWEKKFDEIYLDGRYGNRLMKRNLLKKYTQTASTKDIKQFISSQFQTLREEVEGMKKETFRITGKSAIGADFSKLGGRKINPGDVTEFEASLSDQEVAYNKAIDDILELIDRRLK